jgi:three-Cys-motif partner protein
VALSFSSTLFLRGKGHSSGEPAVFDIEERRPKSAIAITNAYRKRLTDIAGFKYVPEPMPMRNSKGAVIYYLFFASPNETGHKIIKDIFRKSLLSG